MHQESLLCESNLAHLPFVSFLSSNGVSVLVYDMFIYVGHSHSLQRWSRDVRGDPTSERLSVKGEEIRVKPLEQADGSIHRVHQQVHAVTACPLQPQGSWLITLAPRVEPPAPLQLLVLCSVGHVILLMASYFSPAPFCPSSLPNPSICVPSPGAKLSAQAPVSVSRNTAGDAPHFRCVARTCACGAGSDILYHVILSLVLLIVSQLVFRLPCHSHTDDDGVPLETSCLSPPLSILLSHCLCLRNADIDALQSVGLAF